MHTVVRASLRRGLLVSTTAIVVAGLAMPVGAATSRSVGATGYHPRVDPSKFSTAVDNPWFPLTPGTTRVYEGMTEGKPTRTVVTVTGRTRRIDGVDTVVVEDQGFTSGRLEENTTDYFAQDTRGTVWYFGEDTATLDARGKVTSREGTWHAGRGGAQPGIVMEATPRVGRDLRQEYLEGHAEDWYRVETTSTSVTVPFGSFPDALATAEWTPLEPAVRERKTYGRGVGELSSTATRGPAETESLVEVRHS